MNLHNLKEFLKPTKDKIILFFLFVIVYLILNYVMIHVWNDITLNINLWCSIYTSDAFNMCCAHIANNTLNITLVDEACKIDLHQCEQSSNEGKNRLSQLVPVEQAIRFLSFGSAPLLWKTHDFQNHLHEIILMIIGWHLVSSIITFCLLRLKKVFFSKSRTR
jgi:hypothetical protein